MRLPHVLTAALLLGTIAPTAASAATSVPPGKRPHADVATYLRDGLRVTQLRSVVEAEGSTLRVRATVSVHNDGEAARTATFSAGSCRGGTTTMPNCPQTVRHALRIAPGGATLRKYTFTLAKPVGSVDAIALRIAPGTRAGGAKVAGLIGTLLLPSGAWTGRETRSGIGYGIILAPTSTVDVQRASLRGAAESPTRLRATFSLLGTATTPSPVKLLLSGCLQQGNCTQQTSPFTFSSTPTTPVLRPELTRGGASTFGAYVTGSDSRTRLQIALPWPELGA